MSGAFLLIISACGGGSESTTTVVEATTTTLAAATTTTGAADTTTTAAETTTTTAPQELDQIVVQEAFTWTSSQFHLTPHVGMDRGIFADHGIEISEIREGQGSISGAQILANKQADVAIYIDPGAVVRVRAEGGLIKAVAQITPYLPLAVLSKGPDQIETPEDLIGKTIANPPGTTQAQLFPAFLLANEMDAAEINIVNIPPETMQAALAEGQIDGFVSFAVSQIPVLESLGVPDPYALVLADFGFEYRPGETIVFHEDTIAENPDLVRRFVAAFEESIAYTIDDPGSMVEVGTELFPEVMSAEVIEKQWARAAQSIVDEREEGQPYTYMRPEQWEALVKLLVDYAALPDPGPADQFYTTEFIPEP